MVYVLALLIALLLVSAQALWGSAVKIFSGKGFVELILYMLTNPRFWAGAFLYAIATCLYFFLLSKARFFSVQLSMTAAAAVMSTMLAYFIFNEELRVLNLVGLVFVLIGFGFVFYK